jgi:hypothetical protein
MLLVTFTIGFYIGETRRARSHSTILPILRKIQEQWSDVGVAILNDVHLNLITMKQF